MWRRWLRPTRHWHRHLARIVDEVGCQGPLGRIHAFQLASQALHLLPILIGGGEAALEGRNGLQQLQWKTAPKRVGCNQETRPRLFGTSRSWGRRESAARPRRQPAGGGGGSGGGTSCLASATRAELAPSFRPNIAIGLTGAARRAPPRTPQGRLWAESCCSMPCSPLRLSLTVGMLQKVELWRQGRSVWLQQSSTFCTASLAIPWDGRHPSLVRFALHLCSGAWFDGRGGSRLVATMDATLQPLLEAFTQSLAPNPVGTSRAIRTAAVRRPGAAVPLRSQHPSLAGLLVQELIKQAEAFLKQASQQPGYSIMVLKARRRRRRPAGGASRRLAACRLPTAPTSACGVLVAANWRWCKGDSC